MFLGFFLYNKSSTLIIHNPRSEITVPEKLEKKYELNENKNPRNRHTILSYSTEV